MFGLSVSVIRQSAFLYIQMLLASSALCSCAAISSQRSIPQGITHDGPNRSCSCGMLVSRHRKDPSRVAFCKFSVTSQQPTRPSFLVMAEGYVALTAANFGVAR